MLGLLRRRGLTRVAGQLSGELSLNYVEGHSDQRIEGVYRRHIDLASGRFALIEKSREFTLVPWRPVLERHLGKQVSGIARGETISWSLGRDRESGVEGKRVSVRVDLGGRRIIKKKKKRTIYRYRTII